MKFMAGDKVKYIDGCGESLRWRDNEVFTITGVVPPGMCVMRSSSGIPVNEWDNLLESVVTAQNFALNASLWNRIAE